MTQSNGARADMKFRLRHPPSEDAPPGELLWGRWIDRAKGWVSAYNNSNWVPLGVGDVVRVEKDRAGRWQVVEIVRLTESVMTFSSFDAPVTLGAGRAAYQAWQDSGDAVFTEGIDGMNVTTWREFLTVYDVLGLLGPVFIDPGWTLWQAFDPQQRYDLLRLELDFRLDDHLPVA